MNDHLRIVEETQIEQLDPFSRPPRFQQGFEPVKLSIPEPPLKPEEQKNNWLMTALPMSSMLIMGLFYFLIYSARSSGGGFGAIFAIPMLAMGLFSALISLLMFGEQKHQQKINWWKQLRDYHRLLDKKESRLIACNVLQKQWLLSKFPASSQLLSQAVRHSLRLWEKRTTDDDFLAVRLGLGEVPSLVEIEPPDPDSVSPVVRRAYGIYKKHKVIRQAPVVIDLKLLGSIGIVGKRKDSLPLAYSLLSQIVSVHSPEDVELMILSSDHYYRAWRWARWLPHTSTSHQGGSPNLMAFGAQENRHLFGEISRVLDQRIQGRDQQNADEQERVDTGLLSSSYRLCLFDGAQEINNEPSYSILLNDGPSVNFLSVHLCDSLGDVPGECAGVILVNDALTFEFLQVGPDGYHAEGSADRITLAQIDNLARGLLPMSVRAMSQTGRIPTSTNLLEIYGAKNPEGLAIQARWQRMPAEDGLLPFPVRIGSQSLLDAQTIHLAENRDGPHGMIAGTTGSGKSELLQTLVTALALEHHPYFLNLLLIDFKGGSTFAGFKQLPHVAGMVSNLDTVSALRALEAIKAENLRRQRFLLQQGCENINEYHKQMADQSGIAPDWNPLPHLCIIVDEFAQLASDLPDFLPELVATVRLGRSLGLHLILATQRPAGVVNDEMRANLNFRICLRVQTLEDSRDLLHRPDAAKLPPNLPGRAYFQIGDHGSATLFQTAQSGAEIFEQITRVDDGKPEDILIVYESENARRDLLASDRKTRQDQEKQVRDLENQKENPVVALMCDTYATMCTQAGYQKVPQVLLPDLNTDMDVVALLQQDRNGPHVFENWHGLHPHPATIEGDNFGVPIGRLDDLQSREQPLLTLGFRNTVLIGGPGSGKTQFLQTLALSLGYCYAPSTVQIYFLCFSARVSEEFLKLPHVGDIVFGEEEERVDRLIRHLTNLIHQRRGILGGRNWEPHALQQRQPQLPAIFVMLDNFGDLRQHEMLAKLEAISKLMQDGPANGIFFVVTALRVNDIPHKDLNIIQQRLALSQTEIADYINIVGKLDSLGTSSMPAGRGYIRLPNRLHPVLLQLATFVPEQALEKKSATGNLSLEKDPSESPTMIELFASRWEREVRPAPIKLLSQYYRLSDYLPTAGQRPGESVLGIQDADLQPFVLDWDNDGLHYLVIGPPRSGKTNLLHTMILGLAQQYTSREAWLVLIDGTQDSLKEFAHFPQVVDYIIDGSKMELSIAHLLQELEHRLQMKLEGQDLASRPKIFLFIDDYDMVREALDPSGTVLGHLAPYLRRDSSLGLHVVISAIPQLQSDALVRQLKMRRSGFSLSTVDGIDLIGGRYANALRMQELNEGRGFFIQRGYLKLVQIFVADEDIYDMVSQVCVKQAMPPAEWKLLPSESLLQMAKTQQQQNNAYAIDPEGILEEGSYDSMFDKSPEELLAQYIELKKQEKESLDKTEVR